MCRECVGFELYYIYVFGYLNIYLFVFVVGWLFGSNMILDLVYVVLIFVIDGWINKII